MDLVSAQTQNSLERLVSYWTPQERALVERIVAELEHRKRIPRFPAWLSQVTPSWTWHWSYQQYIYPHLDSITNGEIDRLMLFIPPRHGKSEMVTIRYPVWRLERNPAQRIIIGAYNQILANRFSRRARRIAEQRLDMATDRVAVEEWETSQGGGFRAVGVGGGITGQGGHLIIIDDPVKNREEASSATYRDRVWDWYRDDLYTRLEPGGAIVLIMTRWHEDDLAGRILESDDAEQWTVVSLPAEAGENDPLGREIGAALCPDRYDEATLARIRQVLGTWSYSALYQQTPLPAQGALFDRGWFEIVPAPPASLEGIVRYWDKAATEGGGDYSAGALIGKAAGLYYVLDLVRGQWSTGTRETVIQQTAALDVEQHGRHSIWIEQEGGSGGKDSARATISHLTGYDVHAEHPTGDKTVRARPFAAQAEAGNVKLVHGRWNAAYLDELCAFPSGKHDDQVDASSGAFNRLPKARFRPL